LDPILDELVKEGFIRIVRTKRNAKYYALSDSKAVQAQSQAVQPQTDLSSLKDVVKEAVKEVLMEYFGTKEVTVSDLERVYTTSSRTTSEWRLLRTSGNSWA
jgi:DNA-binding PadR family transcriptional regulator